MNENTLYAICWDLKKSDVFLKELFEEFKGIGPKLIYENLYEYHLVENAALELMQAKYEYETLHKIKYLNWVIFSYKIDRSATPKIVLKLFINFGSYLKLILKGKIRSPFYSLTIASVDTTSKDIAKYHQILKAFIKKNRFRTFESDSLSLIEYVSNKWERRVSM